MYQLLSYIRHPLFYTVLGLVALTVLIWELGPVLALGSWRPLEAPLVRLLLIGLILLIVVLRWVWRRIKARRASRKLMEGLREAPSSADAGPTASEQELAQLSKRFDEAVETLRKMRSSGKGGGLSGLLARTGRQYLYELPWYVFIGPPGSGKTTALVNSGLRFPLADMAGGAQAIKGVGGTRNCDWWFTDEAVLIDTAGRYTTQDSDQQVDRAAWQGFLDLLRKFRPRRPINGILLVVSAEDLLTQSPQERAQHAAAARARIEELYERLQVRFPVYLLLTKVDLLAGFTEFFADLGKEERAQVWGATFPYAERPEDLDPVAALEREWQALQTRIFERQPVRLRDEGDLGKRALIFGFPQQLAALRPALADYLGQAFTPSRYGVPPLLRGVYMTSGTQEGRPIDRVIGNVARAFGFEGNPLGMQAGQGRSFFLTRLLNDVIFAERDIAGTNLKWERRRQMGRLAGYATCTIVGIGLFVLWTISFTRNNAFVNDVATRGEYLREEVAQLPTRPDSQVTSLLPTLDAVRRAPNVSGGSGGVPLSMTFGLYQGEKLQAGADYAYRNLLRDSFLPRLIYRMEDRLRSIPASDLEPTYEVLKVYLMLQDRRHLDPEYASALVELDWDQSLPRDVTREQRNALRQHLHNLFAMPDYASPVPADQELVAQARGTLRQFALPHRVYSRMKREGIGEQYPVFSILTKGGPNASLVFERASGKPLSEGVQGIYSHDGYHQSFQKRVGELSKQLAAEEPWVLGIEAAEGGRQDRVASSGADDIAEAVRRLYLQDYARAWDSFISDIRVKRPSSLTEGIQISRILSAPDSPLTSLMRGLVRETTLIKATEEKDLADRTSDRIDEQRRRLGRLFGGGDVPGTVEVAAGKVVESIVDDRFDALRHWVRGPGDGVPPPMDSALNLLNEVYLMLSRAETALQGGNPPPPSEAPARVKAEAARMPEPFKAVVDELTTAGTALILGQTRQNLSRGIAQSFGDFCVQAISGRYPFAANSVRDVTSDDFAALFGPGGMIENYFNSSLAPYVDTSTRPWSLRRVEGVPMGASGALAHFEHADTIKRVFFRGGGQATYRYEFRPLRMDAGIQRFQVDVDGQVVSYSHGPVVPRWVTWPGTGGTSIVRVTVDPPGPTGTGFSVQGPWALLRLFDRARVERLAQPEKMVVTFTFDGREISFDVTAGSVQNPYGLDAIRRFQCPRGLG